SARRHDGRRLVGRRAVARGARPSLPRWAASDEESDEDRDAEREPEDGEEPRATAGRRGALRASSERGGERRAVREALLRVAREAALDDRGEPGRDVRAVLAERRDPALLRARHRLDERPPLDRRDAGEALVEDRSEREDVGG